MNQPESIRQICARRVREYREKRDLQTLAIQLETMYPALAVAALFEMVEERRPEEITLTGIDKHFLEQLGVRW